MTIPSPSTASAERCTTGMDHTERTRWIECSIPERHRRREPNVVAVEDWTKTREAVASQLGAGFLMGLLGKRGTGKTQIAADVAFAACRKVWHVKYATAMDFFLDVRATYKSEIQAERDAIAAYSEPKLLILDELQVRGETDFEDRMLTHLLDKRYGAMRDTLLIANLTAEEFALSVGPSITDRLRECGGLFKCEWGSWRVKK